MTGRGEAAVELKCAGAGACDGKLTLTTKTEVKGQRRRSKTVSVGTSTFSIPAGMTVTVELKLDSIGRRLLNTDRGGLGARLTILKSSPSPSQTHIENVQLVRQKAHGHVRK